MTTTVRRSPHKAEGQVTGTANADADSTHDALSKKRSLSGSVAIWGRLFLLKSRGKFAVFCIRWLLLLVGFLATLKHMLPGEANESHARKIMSHPISTPDRVIVPLNGRQLMEDAKYHPKPRIVAYVSPRRATNMRRTLGSPASVNLNDFSQAQVEKLFNTNLKYSIRELGRGEKYQKRIMERTIDHENDYADDIPEGCQARFDYQLKSFPNCNALHEQDVHTKLSTPGANTEGKPPKMKQQASFITSGGYRLVWYLQHADFPGAAQTPETYALKTFRWDAYDWTERNFDRHRRDAILSDRLTSSPYALHQFAYCGNSGIYEFANGGSLEDAMYDENGEIRQEMHNWTSSHKVSLAYQVARAVADVHNMDEEGRASMSHTDIAARQFISVDGGKSFKINDFNRARFLYQNKTHPELNCPCYVGGNTGRFRSPEEYAHKPETEKIDVYSMGNIIYQLLTGLYPFEDMKRKDVYVEIQKGVRPIIPEKYLSSTDPKQQALVKAIQDCWIHDPAERATARSVEQALKRAMVSDR